MRWHGFLTLLLGLIFSSSLYANEIDEIANSLESLRETLASQRANFVQLRDSSNEQALEKRLQDGIILYSGKDFERASYVFSDIVSRKQWQGRPSYQTALLMLSKSLYEDGYYRLSRSYLLDAVKECRGLERQEAALLLLNVAQRTGDWEGVNEALEMVGESGGEVMKYMRGRAYFLQGDFEKARNYFHQLKQGDEWGMKGAYLLGVINVEENKLDDALRHFEAVSTTHAQYQDFQTVRDLSFMARARVYYEQENWHDALDMYQNVSETSEFFSDVLYEMAWTSIRRGELNTALQNLELLLLSYPNSPHSEESKQVMADIEREMGHYDKALAAYQEILNKYEPVMNEMRSQETSEAEHAARVREELAQGRYQKAIMIPDQARGLLPVGKDVREIEDMLTGLDKSGDNTQSSKEIITEIETVLSSSLRYSILPDYRSYWENARAIQMNLLRLGAQTNEMASSEVKTSTLRKERQDLNQALSLIPQNSHDRQVARALRDTGIQQRRTELHRMKLQSDGIKHRLGIMNSWLDSNSSHSLTETEREELKSKIEKLEQQVSSLEPKQKQIELQLQALEGYDGLSEQALETEDSIIQGLNSAIDSEWSNLGSTSSPQIQKLVETRLEIQKDLDDHFRDIEGGIDSKLAGIRERLMRESAVVNAEEERYKTSQTEVSDSIGDVAARYWKRVYTFVQDMVLGADLGIVDVAWLKKDERTRALGSLMEERKKEREILEQDFQQFLKESGQSQEKPQTSEDDAKTP